MSSGSQDSAPEFNSTDNKDEGADNGPRRRRLRRPGTLLGSSHRNQQSDEGSKSDSEEECQSPRSSVLSSYGSYDSDDNSVLSEGTKRSSVQDSFSLGIEPICSIPREKRFHKRRKAKRGRGLLAGYEECQRSISCIRLPYTQIVRSASDFLQEIFTALSDHERYFNRNLAEGRANPLGTPNARRYQRPPVDNPQHGDRSISTSLDDNSKNSPYTSDWLTSHDQRVGYAQNTQESSVSYKTLFQNDDCDPSLFDDVITAPSYPCITIFASPDPDSVCSVNLLKGSLCSKFSVDIRLILVTCFAQMRHAFKVEKSQFKPNTPSLLQSACFIFLNLGSRQDIRSVIGLGSVFHTNEWKPRLYIIDYRRPICPGYFFVMESESQSSSQSLDATELQLLENSRTPCLIITTDEEIEQVAAERKRTEALLERFKKQKRRKNRIARREAGEEVEESEDENEDDLDCLDEVDVGLQEEVDRFENSDQLIESLMKRLEGEYSGAPSCLVVFESLLQHNLETPGMFFVVATGLAYHLFCGTLAFRDYRNDLNKLKDFFNQIRRRSWRSFHIFETLKFESRELLSPLLRFTSLQDGIQHSRLFLRCQKSWFKTTDMIERELSEIRVQLDLHEGAWADEFRFLGTRDQNRLMRKKLPEIFKLLTMRSRRAHAAEAPDANEDETTNLIIGPAFARIIREVGFPNKVTSIDAAFLLLGILSRPTAFVFSSGSAVPMLSTAGMSSALDPSEDLDKDETERPTFLNVTNASFDFKHIHELRGYAQPLFNSGFSESLRLIEWLTQAGWANQSCKGVPDDGGEASTFGTLSNSNEAETTELCQQTIMKESTTQAPATSQSISYGVLWDSFKSFHSANKTGTTPHQSLSTLVWVCLRIQKDIIHTVLRLLEKRHQNRSESHRRAIGNVEGLTDEIFPLHLHHPLMIKYIVALISDCSARGVPSLCPSLLLIASSIKSHNPAIVVAFKPNTSLSYRNGMGIMIQRSLEHLRLSGVIDTLSQDDFEASLAYIPRNKLVWLFNALFPNVPHRPITIPTITTPSLNNPSRVDSSDDEESDEDSDDNNNNDLRVQRDSVDQSTTNIGVTKDLMNDEIDGSSISKNSLDINDLSVTEDNSNNRHHQYYKSNSGDESSTQELNHIRVGNVRNVDQRIKIPLNDSVSTESVNTTTVIASDDQSLLYNNDFTITNTPFRTNQVQSDTISIPDSCRHTSIDSPSGLQSNTLPIATQSPSAESLSSSIGSQFPNTLPINLVSSASIQNQTSRIESCPEKSRIVLRPRSASSAGYKCRVSHFNSRISSNDTNSPTLSYRSKRSGKGEYYTCLTDVERGKISSHPMEMLSQSMRSPRRQESDEWVGPDESFQTSLSKRRRVLPKSPLSSPRGWVGRTQIADDVNVGDVHYQLSSSLPTRSLSTHTTKTGLRRIPVTECSDRTSLRNNHGLDRDRSGIEHDEEFTAGELSHEGQSCPIYPQHQYEPCTPIHHASLTIHINTTSMRITELHKAASSDKFESQGQTSIERIRHSSSNDCASSCTSNDPINSMSSTTRWPYFDRAKEQSYGEGLVSDNQKLHDAKQQ